MVLALAVGAAAADGVDEAIPDSALCFASVRDVPSLRAKVTSLPLCQLFQKPSVQAFLEEPIREVRKGWKKLEGDLEGVTGEFLDCATGEVAMAVLPAGPAAGQTPNVVLVATVAGKQDEARALLERISRYYVGEGFSEHRHEFASATVVEYFDAREAPGASRREPTFVSLTDRYLLIGDTSESLEQVLAGLLAEPSGGLAAQVDYRRAREALGRSDCFVYLNLPGLEALWEAQSPPGALGPKLVRALGLDEVRVLAFAGGIEGSELSLSGYAAPVSAEGALGFLSVSSADERVPSWVPADALDYVWCNLDFGLLWQTVNATLRSLSPPDYMRFRSLLVIPGPTGPSGPGPVLDVERDLVAPLGQGIWAYSRPQSGGGAPGGSEVAVGVGLKDGKDLAERVERLRFEGVPLFVLLQPTEFQGRRLYTLDAGTGSVALGVFTGPGEEDRLMLAPRLDTLREISARIASGPGAVVRPERFQRAMSRASPGPGTFLIVYDDLQASLRTLGETVRFRQQLPQWAIPSTTGLNLQPGLYPPDEDVLPFLDALVMVGSRSETEVTVKLLLLAPPGRVPAEGAPEPQARAGPASPDSSRPTPAAQK